MKPTTQSKPRDDAALLDLLQLGSTALTLTLAMGLAIRSAIPAFV